MLGDCAKEIELRKLSDCILDDKDIVIGVFTLEMRDIPEETKEEEST